MLKNDFFNIHINPSFTSMYKNLDSATTGPAYFISYGLFGEKVINKNIYKVKKISTLTRITIKSFVLL